MVMRRQRQVLRTRQGTKSASQSPHAGFHKVIMVSEQVVGNNAGTRGAPRLFHSQPFACGKQRLDFPTLVRCQCFMFGSLSISSVNLCAGSPASAFIPSTLAFARLKPHHRSQSRSYLGCFVPFCASGLDLRSNFSNDSQYTAFRVRSRCQFLHWDNTSRAAQPHVLMVPVTPLRSRRCAIVQAVRPPRSRAKPRRVWEL